MVKKTKILTSRSLLEYQKANSFEDIVILYNDDVLMEIVLSEYMNKDSRAIWHFEDGSKVLLDKEVFSEVLD